MTYDAYMQSDLWRFARHLVLLRSGGRCEICHNSHSIQVHHKRYPKILGKEKLSDLIALCKWCHARQHGLTRPWENEPATPISKTIIKVINAL
jgi:5-methylcytosine-specific restriction endonuclease McrA